MFARMGLRKVESLKSQDFTISVEINRIWDANQVVVWDRRGRRFLYGSRTGEV